MFLRVHIHSVKILGIDLIIIIIVFILPLRKNPLKSNISTHTNHTHTGINLVALKKKILCFPPPIKSEIVLKSHLSAKMLKELLIIYQDKHYILLCLLYPILKAI